MRGAMAAAILLLPLAAGAWTQDGGDVGHSGLVGIAAAPLDVVATYSLAAPNAFIQGLHGSAVVDVADLGLVAAEFDGAAPGTCRLVLVADATTGARDTLREQSPGSSNWQIIGYDEDRRNLLVCRTEVLPTGMLEAVNVDTMQITWTTGPSFLPQVTGTRPPSGANWSCTQASIDTARGEFAVVFRETPGAGGGHRIQVHDLESGQPRWSNVVSVTGAPGNPDSLLTPPLERVLAPVQPLAPVMTTDLVIVPAIGAGYSTAAWFTRNGSQEGQVNSPIDDPDGALSNTYSLRFAARAGTALGIVLDRLYTFYPGSTAATVEPLPAEFSGFTDVAPPCWGTRTVMLPAASRALIVDPNGVQPALRWPGFSGMVIQSCIVDAGDGAYVLHAAPSGEFTDIVARVDMETGLTQQLIPVELTIQSDGLESFLLPVSQPPGIFVWTETGDAAFLGTASSNLRPTLELEEKYVATGDAAILSVRVAADPAAVDGHWIAWGDGSTETVAGTGPFEHHYIDAGRYDVSVTTRYKDHRTGTAEIDVRYAQQPLNWMQLQFAPENQDRTWGLIGFAAIVIGAAVAGISRWRRRSRIDREMNELESIRRRAISEPRSAFRDLDHLRARFQRDLRRGRLDDGQYGVLAAAMEVIRRRLHLLILGPYEGKLSGDFRSLLEAAFEDGVIDAQEADMLDGALARQKRLAAGERRELAELIAGWRVPQRD